MIGRLKRFFLVLAVPALVSAQLLPLPTLLPKVSTPLDTVLLKTWQGIKKRNIDAYSTGLVHRPKSEIPGDAVSEGVGYGMILALYANDQTYFNKIWDAGEKYMYNSAGYYDWRVGTSGTKIGTGAASDADQDIALMLIYADLLVKKGIWQPFTSSKGATYVSRAKDLLGAIRGTMLADGKYLMPGQWGGKECLNPGYFAPGHYRVFAEFEPEQKNTWMSVIDASYQVIAKSPGYANGLVPDWCSIDGKTTGGAGYNAYFDGDALYKDAVRVQWRIGVDYLWYGEPRAKVFLDNAYAFVNTPEKANFYQMNGNTLPVTDEFELGNGVTRKRTEYSHLTLGMWACAAMASGGPEAAEPFSEKLLNDFYTPGADFWGKASDANNEDTLHNEMYFDQFLAWFGASVLGGVFTNLWEDFKDPDPTKPLAWITEPHLNTRDINASIEPLHIRGIFNKPARWTVELKLENGEDAITLNGNSDTLEFLWYGLSESGTYMPQGVYNVTISAKGMTTPVTEKVWLGKSMDLMHGTRLLVDDFSDMNLTPYIGKEWTSYLDSHEGKPGLSTVTRFEVTNENGKAWVNWGFKLDGGSRLGYDPYAALEWNCTTPTGNLDLSGIDSIIFTARSQSPLEVQVQLITSDIGDHNFFVDTISLTSSAQEYRLPLSGFVQRWGGSVNITSSMQKITAIRFQIQKPDGTTNAIIMQDMYFTGNVSALYDSPPDYIPSQLPYVINRIHNRSYSLKTQGHFLHITFPRSISGARVTVVNARGAVMTKQNMSVNGQITIDRSKLPSGLFLVRVESESGKMNIPIQNVR